jgi:hypothetical protein
LFFAVHAPNHISPIGASKLRSNFRRRCASNDGAWSKTV